MLKTEIGMNHLWIKNAQIGSALSKTSKKEKASCKGWMRCRKLLKTKSKVTRILGKIWKSLTLKRTNETTTLKKKISFWYVFFSVPFVWKAIAQYRIIIPFHFVNLDLHDAPSEVRELGKSENRNSKSVAIQIRLVHQEQNTIRTSKESWHLSENDREREQRNGREAKWEKGNQNREDQIQG